MTLHSHLYKKKTLDQAYQILIKSLIEKGGNTFELANLGLVEGLRGNKEISDKYFRLAKWWAVDIHVLAVINYNKAVIKLDQGDDEGALIDLKKYLDMSGSEIRKYCAINAYVQEASQRNEEIRRIIAPQSNKRFWAGIFKSPSDKGLSGRDGGDSRKVLKPDLEVPCGPRPLAGSIAAPICATKPT